MKLIKTIFILVVLVITMASCTENSRAKNYGGTTYYQIAPSEKFVNITWKDDNFWVLTEKRKKDDVEKKTYIFKEKSSFNFMEGKIVIVEK